MANETTGSRMPTCSTCQGSGWLDCSGPGYSSAGRRREDVRQRNYSTEVRCEDCDGSGERSHCEVCHTTTRQCDPLFGEDGQCLWCESERQWAEREEAAQMRYEVIYLWQGERHCLLRQFDSREEAQAAAAEMRVAKWQSWCEPVQRRAV
jgi:hypothetical protein